RVRRLRPRTSDPRTAAPRRARGVGAALRGGDRRGAMARDSGAERRGAPDRALRGGGAAPGGLRGARGRGPHVPGRGATTCLPAEDAAPEAFDQVGVEALLLNARSAGASSGFRRVSVEARDLAQVRLAIESLRALEPVLREGGVDEAVVRDLEQARANLQLAY